jgi:phosphoribosyl 1,2-cyclic phosphodiesterase
MAIRLAVLGSGSGGNATLIEGGGARVLVDAGFSCRGLAQRLRYVGVEPDALDAVLVTHEHADHIGGAASFAEAFGVPIHCTRGTARAAGLVDGFAAGRVSEPAPEAAKIEVTAFQVNSFEAGRPFAVEQLEIMPFAVPHDAVDAVGFVLEAEGLRIGYATDLGHGPQPVRDGLRECDLLVIESNHDVGLLRAGPYPQSVKDRVLSRHGHLDNEAAADLLCDVSGGRTQAIVLAHLSQTNNRPELALGAIARRFAEHGRRLPTVRAADQRRPSAWVEA